MGRSMRWKGTGCGVYEFGGKDQLDWVNPKGDKIPYDLSKPLPLHGTPGHLTILVDFFFNKDLEYLTIGNVEKKYATSLTKPKAARYDLEGIEAMITQLWSSTKFGYSYLKELVVRRANQKEYTFKEADFLRLHLNDIEDMYPLYAQNKLHHLTSDEQTDIIRYVGLDNKEPYTIFYEPKGVVYLNKDDKKYLMRADKVYMFGDGTLKKSLDWKRSEADCFHAGEDRKDVADKKDYEEFKVFCGWKKDRDGLQTSYADRMTCHSQVC
ncbi:hypothetical protein Tco_0790797 [Tanacetum coccineum]